MADLDRKLDELTMAATRGVIPPPTAVIRRRARHVRRVRAVSAAAASLAVAGVVAVVFAAAPRT